MDNQENKNNIHDYQCISLKNTKALTKRAFVFRFLVHSKLLFDVFSKFVKLRIDLVLSHTNCL